MIQQSLFDFNDDESKSLGGSLFVFEQNYFFVTNGLFTEKLKYGKEENMRLANKYESREDVINILMKNQYTREQAEEMTEKAYANPDSWYAYKESFYIF